VSRRQPLRKGTIPLADTPTAPEPAAAPFCTRCDGYGVVLPVGSSIVATCPACNGKTADRPERGPKAAPAAAPQVDTGRMADASHLLRREFGAGSVTAAIVPAAADELDAHRARHAELVALVAEMRSNQYLTAWDAADALARILGEQP